MRPSAPTMRIIRRMQRGKPCSRHSASQGRTEESIAGRRQAGPPLHPPPGSGLLDGQRAPRMDVIPLLSRGPSLSWIGRCPLRVSWRSLAQLLKLDLSTAKPQTAQGPCPPAAGLHQKLAGPWFWAWPQLSARVPSITAHPPENPWCPPPRRRMLVQHGLVSCPVGPLSFSLTIASPGLPADESLVFLQSAATRPPRSCPTPTPLGIAEPPEPAGFAESRISYLEDDGLAVSIFEGLPRSLQLGFASVGPPGDH